MPRHWIRVAADPLNLNVVKRASGALSIHIAQAAGHLLSLWSWLSDRTDNGDISSFTDAQLEDGAGWTGKPGEFANFVRTRHVDHRGRIKEWDEFMGPLVTARTNARLRQASRRKAMREATDTEIDERLGRIPKLPPHGSLCAYCSTAPAYCWDHVMPISLGGKHVRKNIVPACNACNAWKLDGPVTAILTKHGVVTEDQQDAWARKYDVFPALEQTRSSFPHEESTFPQRGRHRRSGNSGGGQNLSQEQIQKSHEQSQNPSNNSTEVELRKELSTTGRYLGAELELVSSESLENRPSLNSQNYRDASQFTGIELVRVWSKRFYRRDPNAMLDALKRLRAVLRPAGVMFKGQMIRATPALVVAAMNETLMSPPDNPKTAIVHVLLKLTSGHLHEIRTATGELATDAEANEGKRIGRDISTAFTELGLTHLTAEIGKSFPKPRGTPFS